jgi:predicted dehydrogenase
MTYTLNWGILATGRIASNFTEDLLVDPSTRGVADVRHKVVAVASSSTKDKAEKFVSENGVPEPVAVYGNYNDLVNDKSVDIIYVATPHSHHYDNCKLALQAGKHVCCEKAFTINAHQTEHLIRIAREKKLFLMEAVWTRFFPLTLEVQRLLFEERILGRIFRVHSDLAVSFNVTNGNPKHRMKNPDLGGGALLDLGIYSLTWVFVTAFNDPANNRKPPKVSGSILFTKDTNVDECTSMNLMFPESHVAAVATTSMTGKTEADNCCLIQGEKGYIKVHSPSYRPEAFTVHLYSDPEGIRSYNNWAFSTDKKEYPIPGGRGMFWEADECARCVRDGKLESDVIPLDESLLIMQVMDAVREQNGFKYPAPLESYDNN